LPYALKLLIGSSSGRFIKLFNGCEELAYPSLVEHLLRFFAAIADRAAVVADLVALTAGIREVIERTINLPGPSPHQHEMALQQLVNALQQLEAATNALTDSRAWMPF
jgi:hypothetical protein